MTSHADLRLPWFLDLDQPPTPEMLPLQVLLLTQEVGLIRQRMAAMANCLDALANLLRLPSGDPLEFPSE